jgi:hypothetical protein
MLLSELNKEVAQAKLFLQLFSNCVKTLKLTKYSGHGNYHTEAASPQLHGDERG